MRCAGCAARTTSPGRHGRRNARATAVNFRTRAATPGSRCRRGPAVSAPGPGPPTCALPSPRRGRIPADAARREPPATALLPPACARQPLPGLAPAGRKGPRPPGMSSPVSGSASPEAKLSTSVGASTPRYRRLSSRSCASSVKTIVRSPLAPSSVSVWSAAFATRCVRKRGRCQPPLHVHHAGYPSFSGRVGTGVEAGTSAAGY